MASGQWQINNFPAAAAQATAGQAAPPGSSGSSATSGSTLVNRLRTLTITLSAGANAQVPIQVVVRDGATGAGTVIWTASLSAPINTAAPPIALSGLDLRASLGNAITVEFTGTTAAATQQAVAAGGDTVPLNYPAFGP